ncbi:MAG: hypothetical protein V4726_09010 [Verrucomicrobiota bacterium]
MPEAPAWAAGSGIASIPRGQLPAGPPDRVRRGKMNLRGAAADHRETGAAGFNRIETLTIRERPAAAAVPGQK